MRVASVLLATAFVAAMAACGGPRPFACESNEQCRGESGRCELSGWCSEPDATCPSGRRYEDLAGDDLGGTCVIGDPTGSGDDDDDDDDPTDTTSTGGSESDSTDSTTTDDSDDAGPTGGPTVDAYGMCTVNSSCEVSDSRCLESSDPDGNEFRMCAPPCSVPNVPSTECPLAFEGAEVGCLGTGAEDDYACFIVCTGEDDCPDGMSCALGAVCSWAV